MNLKNLINSVVFTQYMQKLVEEKTPFLTSGIVSTSSELNEFTKVGCLFGVKDSGEGFIRCTRSQNWLWKKLGDSYDDSSSMEGIANRIAAYEARCLGRQILSTVVGIFEASPKDMTVDVSGEQFVPGVTNMTVGNLLDSRAYQSTTSVLKVHSAVYNRMRKTNLIDFVDDPVTGESVPSVQGLRVVFSDDMPMNSNVYTSYLFNQGALGIGFATLPDSTVIEEETDPVSTEVTEILDRKWQNYVQVPGFAWVGDLVSKGGPTNNELASASSWKQLGPDVYKSPSKMTRLITREA